MRILGLIIVVVGALTSLFFVDAIDPKQLSALIALSALLVSLVSAFKADIFPFHLTAVVDEVVLAPTTLPSHDSLALVIPVIFINEGNGAGVVESMALKVSSGSGAKIYTPVVEIEFAKYLSGKRALHAENVIGTFSGFPIEANGHVRKHVLFSQEEQSKRYPFQSWSAGPHTFELFVKTSRASSPQRLGTVCHTISDEMLVRYKNGEGASLCSSRELDV